MPQQPAAIKERVACWSDRQPPTGHSVDGHLVANRADGLRIAMRRSLRQSLAKCAAVAALAAAALEVLTRTEPVDAGGLQPVSPDTTGPTSATPWHNVPTRHF